LLHRYPYRETSLIVEALTREHGRVGVVARGARRPRRGGIALTPFAPLLLSFRQGAELPTLTGVERAGPEFRFTGDAFLAACYLNELLLRLLPRDDPAPDVYRLYAQTLAELGSDTPPAVRRFEGRLIRMLGFLPPIAHDASGRDLQPDRLYGYDPERGPVAAPDGYSGAVLAAVAQERYGDEAALRAAAGIFRTVIESHLGGRPLRTLQVARAVTRGEGTGK